jgi:hypothetical protein
MGSNSFKLEGSLMTWELFERNSNNLTSFAIESNFHLCAKPLDLSSQDKRLGDNENFSLINDLVAGLLCTAFLRSVELYFFGLCSVLSSSSFFSFFVVLVVLVSLIIHCLKVFEPSAKGGWSEIYLTYNS